MPMVDMADHVKMAGQKKLEGSFFVQMGQEKANQSASWCIKMLSFIVSVTSFWSFWSIPRPRTFPHRDVLAPGWRGASSMRHLLLAMLRQA
jgi:hypothetical protein